MSAAPPPDEVYRAVTRLFAVIIIGFGIAIVAVTLANGGGVVLVRVLDRAHLHRARRRSPLPLARGLGLMEPAGPESERPAITRRLLGVPLLFAVAYSAVGFSLYFSLGLVADRGLGLTPLIFLGVGLVFLLNAMTYVEGEAMLPERGGSATFARHGVQERAGQLHRRLGDPDRLRDRDRPRGDLGAALPDPDLVRVHRCRRRDRHRRARDRARRRLQHRRRSPGSAASGCSTRGRGRRGAAAGRGDRRRPDRPSSTSARSPTSSTRSPPRASRT